MDIKFRGLTLLASITIPICKFENWKIYKLHPVPIINGKVISVFSSEHKFVVQGPQKETTFLDSLDHCATNYNATSFCELLNPVTSPEEKSCLMKALAERKISQDNCPSEIHSALYSSTAVIRLSRSKLLITPTQPTTIFATCEGNLYQEDIVTQIVEVSSVILRSKNRQHYFLLDKSKRRNNRNSHKNKSGL